MGARCPICCIMQGLRTAPISERGVLLRVRAVAWGLHISRVPDGETPAGRARSEIGCRGSGADTLIDAQLGGKMKNVTVTTSTARGAVEYDLTIPLFESVDEAGEVWAKSGDNPDEVLLSILNAAQEQNAKQGAKDGVRKAAEEYGPESDEVQEAIAAHQESALAYRIGAARGGALGGGMTKTEAREKGAKIAAAGDEAAAELEALLAKYGA